MTAHLLSFVMTLPGKTPTPCKKKTMPITATKMPMIARPRFTPTSLSNPKIEVYRYAGKPSNLWSLALVELRQHRFCHRLNAVNVRLIAPHEHDAFGPSLFILADLVNHC